jgi:hypothetical protein
MMTDQTGMSSIWAVHSESASRPVVRGWASSEEGARQELEQIREFDGETGEENYWVSQLTVEQVEGYKKMGVIPEDA